MTTPAETPVKARNDDSNPQQGTGSLQGKADPSLKDSRKLFVGGLPPDVTNEEFCTFFRGFGELVEATVMFDRETLKSRGFGFVIFADPAVAQQMVGADGVGRWDMRGKTIEVKPAQPREGTNRRARPKRPQMQHHAPPSPAYPMYYGGYPQPYPMMMPYPDGAYYYPPMPMWEEPVYDPNGYPQPPMNPV